MGLLRRACGFALGVCVASPLVAGCGPSKHHETPPTCNGGGPIVNAAAAAWPASPAAFCLACAEYGAPEPLPSPAALLELSGLAASRAQSDIVYAHNDSGDAARVYVLAGDGRPLGDLCLPNALNIDWEDIAVGPCPAGSCIFAADIGDNDRKRAVYAIYRIAEPVFDRSQGGPIGGDVAFDYFPFVYEDGSHDAESLVIDPHTGDAYVIAKEQGAPVFHVPLTAGGGAPGTNPAPAANGSGAAGPIAVAARVGSLASVLASDTERVTAADVSPCGDAALVRTETSLYELGSLGAGASAPVPALFAEPARAVPVADEIKGEAVTYAEGGGYMTGGEWVGSRGPELNRVRCR